MENDYDNMMCFTVELYTSKYDAFEYRLLAIKYLTFQFDSSGKISVKGKAHTKKKK